MGWDSHLTYPMAFLKHRQRGEVIGLRRHGKCWYLDVDCMMSARPTIDQKMLQRLLVDDGSPCEFVNGIWHSRIHVSPETLKRLNRKVYRGENHDGAYKLLWRGPAWRPTSAGRPGA